MFQTYTMFIGLAQKDCGNLLSLMGMLAGFRVTLTSRS